MPKLYVLRQHSTLMRLAWLLVPALAIAAYAPVLLLWFVGDDFPHLMYQQSLPWPAAFLTFSGGEIFYRPLSTSLIWNLGISLFGTNALRYHALGLILHALPHIYWR